MIVIAAWVFPGAGHWLAGRRGRALLIGGVVWAMFAVAVFSGGLFYPGFGFQDGALLYLLNILARAGNGLGLVIGFFLMENPIPNVAGWATFEYGGRFLEVAGLLNFLAAIDAADIRLGRKQ
jgi:hypothetical protein